MPFSSSKRSFRRSGGISLRSDEIFERDLLRRVLIHAVRIVGLAEEPAAPPLPMMPDSCSGRGSSTNGSIGSFGGFSLRHVTAGGRESRRRLGGSSWPDGETLSGG